MKTNIKITMLVATVFSMTNLAAQVDTVNMRQNSTTTTTTEIEMEEGENDDTVQPATSRQTATTEPLPPVADVNSSHDDDDYVNIMRHGELGVRYMPTFSSLRVRDAGGNAVQGNLSMSHGWGIMGAFNFNRHVGLQVELNYHQINQKYKDRGLDREVNVSYLNVPVLLSLNTNKTAPVNVNFVIGPQFGFNIGADVSGDDGTAADSLHAVVGVKGGDVGAAYGAGLEFALNSAHTLRLDLGFRGYYGLVDMDADQTSNNPDTYNVLLSASRKAYSGYIGLTFLF